MKKVLSLIFVMAFLIVACGDGGDVFNKKSSAEEEQPDITTLPPIKPILTLSPAVLEFMHRCPTVISCMPAERLEAIRIGMELWADTHPTVENKEELLVKPVALSVLAGVATKEQEVAEQPTTEQPELPGGAALANTLMLLNLTSQD